jgi:OOP family OmpA-OmpF porin
MHSAPRFLILALISALTLLGCGGKEEAKKEEPVKQPVAETGQPKGTSAPPAPPAPAAPEATGFDINKVPIVNPPLGQFPYFSLIEGYQRSDRTKDDLEYNRDAAYDRYEFFDGTRIIPVEGRLTTIEAKGEGASPFQIFKTYESLVAGLGGVKVFEGDMRAMDSRNLTFRENRHRYPVSDDDQMAVYVVRMPNKEIWVEAYVSTFLRRTGVYYLTVVEKKAFEAKASLLPAEEMKKEIEAEGHVALYINFDFDKADIKPESQPIVNEIVTLLRNNPSLNLTVEGHTDNVGTLAYNKQLSEARAKSVVAALTSQGIEARRLKAAGFGQEKPISDNSTDEGRAKNRRVELVKMD